MSDVVYQFDILGRPFQYEHGDMLPCFAMFESNEDQLEVWRTSPTHSSFRFQHIGNLFKPTQTNTDTLQLHRNNNEPKYSFDKQQ